MALELNLGHTIALHCALFKNPLSLLFYISNIKSDENSLLNNCFNP